MITNKTSEYLKAHAEIESEGSRVEHVAEEFQRQTRALASRSDDELRSVIVQIALLCASSLVGGRQLVMDHQTGNWS